MSKSKGDDAAPVGPFAGMFKDKAAQNEHEERSELVQSVQLYATSPVASKDDDKDG